MEYHVEYSNDKYVKPEKELFVEKTEESSSSKKKKNLLIIFSISAICIFACSVIYISKLGPNSEIFNNSSTEIVNDDFVINSLLKSKSGKKLIVSKIEELISAYDKNEENLEKGNEKTNMIIALDSSNSNSSSSNNYNENNNDNSSSYKKRFGNLKVVNKQSIVNFFDTKFLMNNLETASAFYTFIKEHHRKYKNVDEMQEKFLIFSENFKKINLHNKSNNLYKKKINRFADLTFEEVKNKLLTLKKFDASDSNNSNGYKRAHLSNYEDVLNKYKPKDAVLDYVRYDWRLHKGVTPVKDQGNCGSCWAFSVVGVIESQYAIRKNEMIFVSEQELVDCSLHNFGCDGGFTSLAFEDIIDIGGLCTEDEYPYVANMPEMCQVDSCQKKYTINSYVEVPEDKYKEAIQFVGPITISVAASEDFIYYDEGIFDGECAGELNHAVSIVGYGVEEKYNSVTKKNDKHYYYIIKNSWGKYWGENGYMRIKTDEFGLKKTCSLDEAYIPLVE
ncbi:vivapain-2 [Plasmodium brasilianum]|uniref:Vivapain n=2 Tax=Plasmodium (Plasmodium) TaxID=418103 RepID=A0A1A8W2I6_PLAMA|nr:vivapain-2, putative [Plasmodium malariae]KAI4838278.1 vivapain-2 [Plasmodium brasilianum]SBS85357.1 vivapain [Plasmodium malariae]SCN12673.1 vivapain-2, putative [Plasmodium malariae]